MKYAKLINGCPQFAPNPIRAGENWVGNPSEAVCLAQGFKPVSETDYPAQTPPAGYRWQLRWTETESFILQSWELSEIPPEEELSAEEALTLLLGGEEL